MSCHRNCTCVQCEQAIQNKFKPFVLEKNGNQATSNKPCPQCSQPCYPNFQGGFIVYTCWRCNCKLMTVTKIINQVDGNFGFGENADGIKGVFFHQEGQVDILYDGSQYPILIDIGNRRMPQINDILVYQEILDTTGRPRAVWWAYESQYEAIRKALFPPKPITPKIEELINTLQLGPQDNEECEQYILRLVDLANHS